MFCTSSKHDRLLSSRFIDRQSAFTIVELLIVIVVIAILATLTIVGYTGIQDNARKANLKGSLTQYSKSLEIYKLDNTDTYPPNLSTINLASNTNTTLSYTPVNTANPPAYCLQATSTTNTDLIYHINASNPTPGEGGCIITNLVSNPQPSSSSSGYGTTGNHTITWYSGINALGGNGYVKSVPNVGNGDGRSFRMDILLQPGTDYTFTSYIRITAGPAGGVTGMTVRYDTWGNFAGTSCNTVNPGLSVWARITCHFTTPDTSYIGNYGVVISTIGSTTTTIDTSNWIITQSSAFYDYADGSSAGWSWSGTANNSTSTGPAL